MECETLLRSHHVSRFISEQTQAEIHTENINITARDIKVRRTSELLFCTRVNDKMRKILIKTIVNRSSCQEHFPLTVVETKGSVDYSH